LSAEVRQASLLVGTLVASLTNIFWKSRDFTGILIALQREFSMLRYLPWEFIVRRAARAYGFADPALWLARIRNFAQPSEVQEPIELVRAGVLFHARGVVNAKAIQHNLDWVWPYWVERQFDPEDISFIPRAFSFSHINLTHRNWTAVGLPELPIYPIVDPRGLVTPLQDGWSIDFWIVDPAGRTLLPSRLHDDSVQQRLVLDDRLAVTTRACLDDLALEQTSYVTIDDDQPTLHIDVRAISDTGGSLVMAIRPYNPEGVQFIDRVVAREQRDGWCVNATQEVITDPPADRLLVSDYAGGDVFSLLNQSSRRSSGKESSDQVRCKVGMATAASVFHFDERGTAISIRVPLTRELPLLSQAKQPHAVVAWPTVLREAAALQIPNQRMQFLYEAGVRTVLLLSANEIVPGPYTYRRFWFRDACLMMNAMLAIGLAKRCREAIERFPARQLRNGYFRSQEGEWDSNGQVLWIIGRYEELSGEDLNSSIVDSVARAVEWIDKKRARGDAASLHDGLLPAGFSAEHLGPNDHYYWDDFWAEAGLRSAERIFHRAGRIEDARKALHIADEMKQAIQRSVERIEPERSLGGIPASPYRRMDAGAIGSLVADYPLQLFPPGDPQIMATAHALLRRYFHKGGFFQDIIHSGINAYLTLDVAQTLLRAGDARYRELIETVARLASPTGQWPEAIHPQTLGGCMGDGQHGWAAAEWIMMLRNCFVREEADRLIIGSGLFEEWFATDNDLYFGPTLTRWGTVEVRISGPNSGPSLTVDTRWRASPARVDIAIPGFRHIANANCAAPIGLERTSSTSLSDENLHHVLPGTGA
jgi:hypothetical protein